MLLGTASAATLATLGATGRAAAADAAPQPQLDLDTGNFLDWFQPQDDGAGVSPSSEIFGPMDVTVFLWINVLTGLAWYDAVAPYTETAVGVHSRIKRRPSSESATNRNMNTAAIHAQYRLYKGTLPSRLEPMRKLMTSLGLNPDDDSTDPTSPVGIGNIAGKAVFEARKEDGMNYLGYEGGRRYNPMPWADYTGYKPVNTAFELVDPTRWQPLLHPHNGRRVGGGPGDLGIYVTQHFVTPQIARVKPHLFPGPDKFSIAPPDFSNDAGSRKYRRAVDEILEASAGLTDEQKAITEVMDNKIWGIGHSALVMARSHDKNGEMGVEGWAKFILTHLLATFEPLIVTWHHKRKYDAVRPVSAVRHLYRRDEVTSWGGPGKGTVKDMPGREWSPYLPTGDHPEYPSGSTTICSSSAQAARRYFGTDALDWKFTFRTGTSRTEPGFAPAHDVPLHFATWTDFAKNCAVSRVWGGVHFKKTVERSLVFGEQFGDLAHEFVERHSSGEAKD
ncbi:hypothetical protein E2651_09620 [Streptomyces sp. MZ04]|nr:hypothetical protein E2651_09620 [Streptomyces sp. MZ04]